MHALHEPLFWVAFLLLTWVGGLTAFMTLFADHVSICVHVVLLFIPFLPLLLTGNQWRLRCALSALLSLIILCVPITIAQMSDPQEYVFMTRLLVDALAISVSHLFGIPALLVAVAGALLATRLPEKWLRTLLIFATISFLLMISGCSFIGGTAPNFVGAS